MNICFVSDYYTDFIGGGERSLANQMAALRQAGHAIFLIRPHQSHQPQQPNELAVKAVYTWRVGGSVLPITPHTPSSTRQIRTFLQQHNIDVIHSQGQGGISYTTWLVARRLSLPFVDTVHTFFWQIKDSPGTQVLRPVAPWFLSWILGYRVKPLPKSADCTINERCIRGATLTFAKKVDLVISPSQHQRDALQAAGLTTPVACIPNPLPLDCGIGSAPLPDGPLRLVWAGRMNQEKRLPEFARALVLVEQQRPGKCLTTIIGDGNDQAEARQITTGLPGVSYVGLQDQDFVINTLDQSHILVLTSYHFDNQPMVITEAVSRNRGVLYCDERLAPEIGTAGMLTTAPDAAGLARAIIDCIDHPEKVAELSRSCQQQIELFRPEHFVQSALAAYETVKKHTSHG